MKQLKFFLFLTMLFSLTIQSQDTECGFDELYGKDGTSNTQNFNSNTSQLPPDPSACRDRCNTAALGSECECFGPLRQFVDGYQLTDEIRTLPVLFYLYCEDSELDLYTTKINELIVHANNVYASSPGTGLDTRIRFKLAKKCDLSENGIIHMGNQPQNNPYYDNEDEKIDISTLYENSDTKNYINVIAGDGVGSPSGALYHKTIMRLKREEIIIDVASDFTFVHELGHILGLLHTHGSSECYCGDGAVEYLVDENGNEILDEDGDEIIDPATLSNEMTDDTNCKVTGDFICDTYPYESSDADPGFDFCTAPYDCNFDYTPVINGDFPPVAHSFMSYFQECRDRFTYGQVVRMNALLSNKNCEYIDYRTLYTKKNLLETGALSSEIVVVEDGEELVLDDDIYFQSGGGIVVKKGGRLIVEGATLTTCDPSILWEGIVVEGEKDNQPINANYPNYNYYSPNHGVVILHNAFIQNAKIGVYAKSDGSNPGIGIVHAIDSYFVNNGVGILMEMFNAAQSSIVRGCTFDSEGNHIGLLGNQGLVIEDNDFTNTSTAGRGVGINSWSSSVNIGSVTDVNSRNRFENLYKGIDVYSLLNPGMVADIYNNDFTNVEKGVTLNTTGFNIIQGNKFLDIPASPNPNNPDAATYGVQALQAFSIDVRSNVFEASSSAVETYGLILAGTALYSHEKAADAEIDNNTFRGPFTAATEIEGDNSNLDFTCNNYAEVAGTDWRFVQKAVLDQQGILDADEAFTNTWNTDTDNSNYHIDANDVSTSIMLIPDNPTNDGLTKITGNVFIPDVQESDVFCPDSPGMPPPDPPGGDYEFCWLEAAQEANDLKSLVHKRKYELVKEELICKDKVWGDKLLVAVFAGEKDFVKARDRLERVPQDTEPNQEFYQTYDAVLTILENGSTNGKSQSAENLLRSIANPIGKKEGNARSETNVLAQAALAVLYGEEYNRGIAGKNSKETNQKLNYSQNILNIFPNPAQNQIRVEQNVTDLGILSIFDQQGVLVLEKEIETTQLLDISGLNNGIYFTNIKTDNIVSKTVKLIILR